MKYKIISCNVFTRSVCMEISRTPHVVDSDFTELGAHENADNLREIIQKKIDNAEGKGYDAILLGYGLCGNSTAGIAARSIPIVIPRAHDCCTIFMGSREKFLEAFKDNMSAQWSSIGYMERGESYLRDTDTGKLLGVDKEFEEYVTMYGEENARYIWETIHPQDENTELIYIDTPGLESLGYLEKFKEKAKVQGKTVRVLKGDMRLIRKLIRGDWSEDDFLVVPPGKKIKAIYDQKKIFCI
jgi:hypothetical protein